VVDSSVLSEDEHWRLFYEQALDRKHSEQTAFAAQLNSSGNWQAVDCGCGTGSDSHYLSQQGYQVQGFDINEQAVALCQRRFAAVPEVEVCRDSFDSFSYPLAGLVIARSSLYFANPATFADTWARIVASIVPGGVFSGDFVGENDSWVYSPHHQVTAVTESKLSEMFEGFEIVRLSERDEPGKTALGYAKHWHSWTVTAVKR